VTLVLDMKLVLTSCAEASKLECRRELLAHQLKYFDLGGLLPLLLGLPGKFWLHLQ